METAEKNRTAQENQAAMNASENTTTAKKKKNKNFGLVLAIILIVGGGGGYFFYEHGLHHEETENAQVKADVSPVISRVSGYVERVLVEDNQQVKAGDTLLIIDDRDYVVHVKEAEAALAIAKSNLEVAQQGVNVGRNQVDAANASVLAAEASIEEAKVRQWRAQKDFERYENLWKDHTVTEQQYEEALAEKQAADRQLELLQKQREIAQRQSRTSNSESTVTNSRVAVAEASVKQSEAALEAAKLNLSYTAIVAKFDGQLSAIDIEPGQMVQAGQSLFNIVNTANYWVVANFKETQLENMQIGQEVEVVLDAYPGHEFMAKVSSFSPATGNTFALLPADNATGNFVKVVQKVPVKIVFEDQNDPFMKKVRAGMNAEVDVHIN